MASAHDDPDELVIAQVAERWQALDPLLPVPSIPAAADGERFRPAAGRPHGLGGCGHWAGTPGTLEMCWGAARRFELTARVGGQDVTEALDQLLTAGTTTWPRSPARTRRTPRPWCPGPAGTSKGSLPCSATGFSRGGGRGAVRAARFQADERASERGARMPLGLQIRRAGPADLDVVVRLEHLVVRYDAHFGEVADRPWTADALRTEAKTALAAAEPWVWLAERDGQAVGVLQPSSPPTRAGSPR